MSDPPLGFRISILLDTNLDNVIIDDVVLINHESWIFLSKLKIFVENDCSLESRKSNHYFKPMAPAAN